MSEFVLLALNLLISVGAKVDAWVFSLNFEVIHPISPC